MSHINASHSRQPLVKGERLVRHEVNAVIPVCNGECTRVLQLKLPYSFKLSIFNIFKSRQPNKMLRNPNPKAGLWWRPRGEKSSVQQKKRPRDWGTKGKETKEERLKNEMPNEGRPRYRPWAIRRREGTATRNTQKISAVVQTDGRGVA